MQLLQRLGGLFVKARFFLTVNYIDAFDASGPGKYSGGTGTLNDTLKNGAIGIYVVVFRLGIFASAVAALIAFALMFYNAQNPQAASESKKKLVRILFCVALLFGIPSLIGALMNVKL